MTLARRGSINLCEMVIRNHSTFILSKVVLVKIMPQPLHALCLPFCSRIGHKFSHQQRKCDEKIYSDWNGIGLTIVSQIYIQRNAGSSIISGKEFALKEEFWKQVGHACIHVYPCLLVHNIKKVKNIKCEGPGLTHSMQHVFLNVSLCLSTASNFCCQSLQHISPLLPPESGPKAQGPLELPAHDDVFRYVNYIWHHCYCSLTPSLYGKVQGDIETFWGSITPICPIAPSTMLILNKVWATMEFFSLKKKKRKGKEILLGQLQDTASARNWPRISIGFFPDLFHTSFLYWEFAWSFHKLFT